MRRVTLFILMLFFTSLIFSQEIYFSEPTSNSIIYFNSNGKAAINYHFYHDNSIIVHKYYAKLTYPDGSQSKWQTEYNGTGETGGWWVNKAGTYQIQGKAWVTNIFYGNSYWTYRYPFSFSVVDTFQSSPPPLTVNISGPTFLSVHENGTWTANASGGTPGYHYQWWYEYPANGPNLPGGSKKPGHGYWIKTGSDSKYLTRQDDEDFELKVDVTDAHNTKVTSSVFYVTVGEGNMQERNNFEKTGVAEEIPTATRLMNNYPNPFNPTTVIKYQLKEPAHVILRVYDVLGKEVAELVNERKSAGYYSVNFDGSKLPSGLYIYRLQANNYVESKKMLLTK